MILKPTPLHNSILLFHVNEYWKDNVVSLFLITLLHEQTLSAFTIIEENLFIHEQLYLSINSSVSDAELF